MEITHNVEFALHPILAQHRLILPSSGGSITARRLFAALQKEAITSHDFEATDNTLHTKAGVFRNACAVAHSANSTLRAILTSHNEANEAELDIVEQFSKPYAIMECKRVGIEEGAGRGPQTIEKAKQGAYVAKSVSSLHKLRSPDGILHGLVFMADGSLHAKPYDALIAEIIASNDAHLLRSFVLTVGMVSNHGNWFTSENHNKELKVLAQSYDWLLFLTDEGLSTFITETLLSPVPELQPVRNAFAASYTADKKANEFTKVRMRYEADRQLTSYFQRNMAQVETWFNVIAPIGRNMQELKTQLETLRRKDWQAIHNL